LGLKNQEEIMVRIIVGAVVGFTAWSVIWVGSEKVLSAIWPDWYGAHQVAFEAAVVNGGAFTPDTTILWMNIVRGAIISAFAGFLAALIAREKRRSPLILAIMLVAFCLVIMAMSRSYVPLWYLIILTTILFPMTLLGGRLKKFA
jgi:hypothetical protein